MANPVKGNGSLLITVRVYRCTTEFTVWQLIKGFSIRMEEPQELNTKYTFSYYYLLKKTLILLSLQYAMEPKKGDEHLHHPVCEVCQKEFDSVHELSKHVNAEHRNQDRAA